MASTPRHANDEQILLAALKTVAEYFADPDGGNSDFVEPIVRAAIAKAEGRPLEPRFLTPWEREDYEREKCGEKPLGPTTAVPPTCQPGWPATDPAVLERQIMDSRVPKNEREWWAAREITRLRKSLLYVRGYIQNCDHEPAIDEIDAALSQDRKPHT